MPVYDRVEFLANALSTVYRQSHVDWEVILKDGCPERPSFSPNIDSRVRVLLSKDSGIFPGLNEALHAAAGDVLYFMCSDDELAPRALEYVADKLPLDEPAWLYGRGELIDKIGRMQGQARWSPTSYSEMLSNNQLFQPSVFWNRAMYEAVGDFNESLPHAADYDMWLRMWKVTEPIWVPKVLGRYRAWPGTNSSINATAQSQEARQIASFHR